MYSDSEIFKNCKKLTEYTKLIDFINQERQNFSEDALDHAISKAIQQGILTDFAVGLPLDEIKKLGE